MPNSNRSIGIVGLPNVGKSTLFKALTKNPVNIANYPFCTIEPNVGIVKVPDERLEKIAKIAKAEKIVPTIIEFVDIAGLVKGAAEGEGLGNQFLAHIREVDAIAQVVRVFPAQGGSLPVRQAGVSGGEDVVHVFDTIDSQRDIEIVNTELILADLETVKKRTVKLEQEVRGMGKDAAKKLEIIKKIEEILQEGKLARELELGEEEYELIKDLCLLTWKPIIYVLNKKQDEKIDLDLPEEYSLVEIDLKIEEELSEMSSEEIEELGVKSNLDELILKCYEILDLITFFTIANRQVQAWTVKKSTPLPKAGGVIHTDFEEKFIRADVISWQKLLEAGSWSHARELGWLRTEGKEYVVQNGDVMEFRI